jgi:hypothetical protein
LAIVADAVEKDYGIVVRVSWTRKPALEMAAIAGSDGNILQKRTESGGSSLGFLALGNEYSLRAEGQFFKEDRKDRAD